MRPQRPAAMLGTLVAASVVATTTLADPLHQPNDLAFSDTLDASASHNVAVGSTDGAEHIALNVVTSGAEGDWYRATRSARGSALPWMDLQKDALTSGTSWGSVDECLDGSLSAGSLDADGYLLPHFLRVDGGDYRIGPLTPEASDGQATLSSGATLAPPIGAIRALRFLTGAGYGGSDAEYTVVWEYGSGGMDVVNVPIADETKLLALERDTTSAWHTVRTAGSGFPTVPETSCVGLIDEVAVFVPSSGLAVSQVSLHYDDGLSGPMALSLEVNEDIYEAVFNDGVTTFYEGTYQTASGTLSADPTSGSSAIWYAVTWAERVTDAEMVPLGDVEIEVRCGDGSIAGHFSTTRHFDDNAAMNPLNASGSGIPDDPPGQFFCHATEAAYEARLTSWLDRSPILDGVTLMYTLDEDGDKWGVDPIELGGEWWPADCDDTDPNIHPGAEVVVGNDVDENCDGWITCYVDADRNGFGSSLIVQREAAWDGSVTCDDPLAGFADNAGDCDDAASSCADDCTTDIDMDGIPDCIDLCIDLDGDGYGIDNGDAFVGSATVRVGECTIDGTTPCDHHHTACLGPDGCPDDPNKTEPGLCGCGVLEGDCAASDAGVLDAGASDADVPDPVAPDADTEPMDVGSSDGGFAGGDAAPDHGDAGVSDDAGPRPMENAHGGCGCLVSGDRTERTGSLPWGVTVLVIVTALIRRPRRRA